MLMRARWGVSVFTFEVGGWEGGVGEGGGL